MYCIMVFVEEPVLASMSMLMAPVNSVALDVDSVLHLPVVKYVDLIMCLILILAHVTKYKAVVQVNTQT